MADDPRPPVAIRITRPYATEEEYLERELDTLTRTGIVLIGAQPRPEGAVLRFELALTSGAVLLRGEGRVTGYKVAALLGAGASGTHGGLALRFTRLDLRSKALVDRAAAIREQRRSAPALPSSERAVGAGTFVTGAPPPLPSSEAAVGGGVSATGAPPPLPSSERAVGASVSWPGAAVTMERAPTAPSEAHAMRSDRPGASGGGEDTASGAGETTGPPARLSRRPIALPPISPTLAPPPFGAGGRPTLKPESMPPPLPAAARAGAQARSSSQPPPFVWPPGVRRGSTPAAPSAVVVDRHPAAEVTPERRPAVAAPAPARPSQDRDALLDRLRARARGLDEGVLDRILSARGRT